MNNALATQEVQALAPLTAETIKAQADLIQSVIKKAMKTGIHFGRIPGCGEKPTLLKPGAEKILSMFHIAADPQIEDLSTADEIRYRVKVCGTTPHGAIVGYGIGECSSGEDKYRWRKATCDQEYDDTPEDRRRIKWGRGKTGVYQTKQVRMQPADVGNTVLKMAKKRALIDLTLTATAASDCFTQDLDDLPQEVAEAVAGEETQPTIRQPQRQSDAVQTATFTITNISKAATKTGGLRYTFTDDTGQKFHSFDEKITEFIKSAKQPVTIAYHEGKYGRDIEQVTVG